MLNINRQNESRLDVVCFGGEDWWYKNRAHIDIQLMRRYTKNGTVLYINSIVMQKPHLSEIRAFIKKLMRKSKSIFTGLKKSDAGFWVYSPVALPVHHISWAKPINEKMLRHQILKILAKLNISNPLIWVACPAACDTALQIDGCGLVYQRTDKYEEFPNVDFEAISKYDRKLKAKADLTIFVSQGLYEKEAVQCRNAFYLDHGVDYEMFASAGKSPTVPSDIAGIKKPVVGFFGAIDKHTFDINFFEKVVDLLPDLSFVIVGKASIDCSSLKMRKNLWMLGEKSYEQIPEYGKCFGVAIMPWRQNKWIESCNPIKTKEYLALGKPVVSTPYAELKKYFDVIYEATTPEGFAESIIRALSENSPDRILARRNKVRSATWDSKAQLVLDSLFSDNISKVQKYG